MANRAGEKLPKTDQGLQAWLQNRRPPEEREWIALGHGLTVCLAPSGDKTFQARLRRLGDKNARRVALGAFPACSVAEARQRLAAARAAVREGRDPGLDRRRARQGVEEIRTFGQLADRYLADRVESGRLRPKTIAVETQAVAKLRHALGDRLLADLEPRDIAHVVAAEAARLRKAGRSGRSANIMLAVCKRIFREGRAAGVYNNESPAAALKRPASEQARERVLLDGKILRQHPGGGGDEGEIGRLAVALTDADAAGPDRSTRAAIYLALSLGMRAGEVCAMEWSAIRLDDEVPTLTIVRGKTQAATRTLPLPPQAVAILRTLKSTAGKSVRFVFPARNDGGRAEHLHAESLSRAFSRLCERLGIEGATLHDARRTCLSALVELTGDEGLVEKIAGHKGRSVLRVHYDKSKRLDDMLTALAKWADAIDDAVARARAEQST
jgi:integrase